MMGSITSPIIKTVGKNLLVAVLLVGVSGCSYMGIKAPWNDSPSPNYELIAANLVNSLSQVPHLDPMDVKLQIGKPRSSFDRNVKKQLQERGYSVETVWGKDSINRVSSNIRPVDSKPNDQKLYVLSVGQVSIERVFGFVSEQTTPLSKQVVRGVSESESVIELNDFIFEALDQNKSTAGSVVFRPYEGPQIADVLAPAERNAGIKGFWRKDTQSPVKSNVYENMASNYQGVFLGYEDIEQKILVFPNDSLRLGEANKHIIESFVSKMDPDTDILSVIGCSHGATNISNGNSLLALGRANRVKEAFLFSGLEHHQILEEGCWAPQTFDEVMPRRGVVLTLKRQKKS